MVEEIEAFNLGNSKKKWREVERKEGNAYRDPE
jgi:hypothetical protein